MPKVIRKNPHLPSGLSRDLTNSDTVKKAKVRYQYTISDTRPDQTSSDLYPII